MLDEELTRWIVTFEVEIKSTDQRSEEDIQAIIRKALDAMPDTPYLDYTDFSMDPAWRRPTPA